MKNTIRNPQIIKAILCLLLLGTVIGYGIGDDFVNLYISKIGQIPVRYTIIIVVLFIDYTVFENMNHYIYIFRYKSVSSFISRSIITELFITLILLVVLHVPIFILNSIQFLSNLPMFILSIINVLVVISLILTIIRFINIWVNNRIISTGVFIIIFFCLDVLLEHYNYFIFNYNLFDFKSILTLPFIYPSYVVIATVMIIVQIFLLEIIKKLIIRKDYILKQDEEDE